MTAVVAIMNKTGLALAADSAVTVTNGVGGYSSSKIYNTANKLFMLSKYHPIGIMVYSSADFMQVPWELIIKLYRKHIGDESFKAVSDYRDDFLRFMVNSSHFSFIEKESSYLPSIMNSILSFVTSIVNENLSRDIEVRNELDLLEGKDLTKKHAELITEEIKKIKDNFFSNPEKIKEFEGYEFQEFSTKYQQDICKAFKNCVGESFIDLDAFPELKEELLQITFEYLTRNNFIVRSTGIVFAGFGDSEIYPSLCSIDIDCVLDGKLRYADNQVTQICEENRGAIIPFAQKDVMHMFIEGIDPNIEQVFEDAFVKVMKRYNLMLANAVEDNKTKEDILNIDIDILKDIFRQDIIDAKQRWQIIPTINTVEILSKEDLAEMAESLIYLTFLKKRTSSNEENVGGPIDVAIISKGDGFIWKNRKHYFEKDLNQHFFSNYYNKE
ncbi:hypothetical protein [Psychrobacter sp. UBA6291]|uniref:hypothetical protein n=1 Tax=Psychrobacter sp. UBA6291 TaxID=1947357 RepID=UPI0025806C4D|nr:hypothetical protein [Psychrobacter sp. UBA6291]